MSKLKTQYQARGSKWLAATLKSWKATAKKWRTMSKRRESIGGPSNKEMRAKAETLELCVREIELKQTRLGQLGTI